MGQIILQAFPSKYLIEYEHVKNYKRERIKNYK
jgi:hypothetical protein